MSVHRFPQSRAERLIAFGRLILAAASFGAVYLDPLEPSRYPAFTYSLLAAYCAYALGVAYWTASARTTSRGVLLASHVVDLLFLGTINILTFSPTSPFFVFFVFNILCAMLRFGRRGTIVTAVVAVLVFTATGADRLWTGQFELNRFIIRLTYLFVVGSMLIYLAGYHERIQRDLERIAQWPRSTQRDPEELLGALMTTAASIFHANRIILAYEHLSTRVACLGVIDSEGKLHLEKQPDDVAALLFAPEPDTFFADAAADETAGAADGEDIPTRRLPPEIARRFGVERGVAVSFEGESVRGRLFLLDGAAPLLEEVHLARIAGSVIAGRLDHFHAAQQLERGAVAEERVRVARDLHDSVLQSLTGVALQLRTLPKLMVRDRAAAEARLAEVEQVIVTAQRELRWFIDELRPERGRAEDALGERLASLAQRFREQWGMEVENHVAPVVHLLPLGVRYDIYAIVNEAVANAARHAHAKRVTVAVHVEDSTVTIDVVDDGRGFPFRGRYDLQSLMREDIGPLTLKERVSSLGGSMILDSSERGAKLEIRMPLDGGG